MIDPERAVTALADMVLVPAGSFRMGSGEFDFEGPPHDVDVAAFYIDRYPVTVDAYARFVEATGHAAPPDWDDAVLAERGDHPVDRVTWHDARAYAAWAGKRLPTEPEWEKASRGTDGRRWPWGETFDESRCIVWDYAMAIDVTTLPVDSHPSGASPYGVEQMAGNVEEWVEDVFLPYPGSTHASPSASGALRVLRGGSWFFTQEHTRCAYRRGARPEFDGWTQAGGPGFRCAKDAPAQG
jgi:formylglycine-generating enzyme required for sulfatase activity